MTIPSGIFLDYLQVMITYSIIHSGFSDVDINQEIQWLTYQLRRAWRRFATPVWIIFCQTCYFGISTILHTSLTHTPLGSFADCLNFHWHRTLKCHFAMTTSLEAFFQAKWCVWWGGCAIPPPTFKNPMPSALLDTTYMSLLYATVIHPRKIFRALLWDSSGYLIFAVPAKPITPHRLLWIHRRLTSCWGDSLQAFPFNG